MGKKSKRKTRWRSLPIGDVSSQNEDECDDELHNGHMATRPKFRPRGVHQRFSNTTPTTHEKKQLFNEDEYTKITTPRQDVLFKKGYLGRRRTPQQLVSPAPETVPGVSNYNGDHENGVVDDNQSETSSETVTSPQEMPPPMHLYNGFMDPHGGPIFYLNGGYDVYEPYSGVYSSFMVPTGPAFPGGGQVLTAVPCQPLPLQPLEWFNPRPESWCLVPASCGPPPQPPPLQRKKRYSTDSQNCSPHSSESTGPPGSPQHEEEVGEMMAPDMYGAPPPTTYVYPGYMFGPAVYNVNGVAVPGPNPVNGILPDVPTNNVVASVDSSAASKKRKKKRRRKRKRGFRSEGAGTDEGSEESSSEEGPDEKDATEDYSVNHNGNKSPEGTMSHSSPGISSGTDSAPASLPPGTSESCSELSTASSSHNSHDETEPIPVRPSRKQSHERGAHIKEKSPNTTISSASEPIADAAEPVSPPDLEPEILESQFDQPPISESSKETEADENEIKPEIEKLESQEIFDVNITSVSVNESLEDANTAETAEGITVSKIVTENIVQTQSKSHSQMEVNVTLTPEKSRKLKRKPKNTKQMDTKCNSEESVPEIRMTLATPEPFVVSAERPSSSLECCETDGGRISPVPPPRRRGRARHRPPTPCVLLTDQETLAKEISEQIISDAVVEAIRHCTISSEKTDDAETVTSVSRPITDAVTCWLNASPDPLISTESDEEDEDERRNSLSNMTGSKNGIVNPLPAPSNRFVDISTDGPEKRVEKDIPFSEPRNNSNIVCHVRNASFSTNASSEGCCGEWDSWEDPMTQQFPSNSKSLDSESNCVSSVLNSSSSMNPATDEHNELPTTKYDPKTSVAKYYKLSHNPTVIKLKQQEAWLSVHDVISDSGIESGDEPPSPKLDKTERSLKFVRHIQGGFPETEPFPCGACCSIQ